MAKEQKQKEEQEVKADAKVDANADGVKEEKELTPEEKREAEAQQLVITLYGDGQIKVEATQNVTNRAQAEFMVHRALSEYNKRDVASMTAMTILDSIAKSQDKKRIHVPGR